VKTRVAIVGAGAVGGYVGAHMSRAGEDVILIDHYPEHVAHMQKEGITISGPAARDNFSTGVNALHISDVQHLSKERPVDVALIGVKSYDTAWATELIAPYLRSNGIAASIQNGINDSQIARVVGWERTLGVTVAGCGGILHRPGHIRRSNVTPPGGIVFRAGETHGRTTPRAQELARVLSAADGSAVTNNLWGERWSKLVVNSMRMGLATVTKINIPEQDRNDITRGLMIRLGAEAVRVGLALGYQLVKMQGIEAETMLRAGDGDPSAIDEITRILLELANSFADNSMPSMAQDIAKGRRTEADGIYGLIVRKGQETEIPTPVNLRILELVNRLERGEIEPSIEVVRNL